MQVEIAVLRRFADDVFGQQQRAEQFGVPGQLLEREEGVRRGQRADGAFEHGAAVQRDAGGLGDLRGSEHGRGPPFLVIFRANTLAAPSAARLKASSTLSIDSSAMIGDGLRCFRRAMPGTVDRA